MANQLKSAHQIFMFCLFAVVLICGDLRASIQAWVYGPYPVPVRGVWHNDKWCETITTARSR